VLFEDATTIFRYKNASPSALNPDIAKNAT
jgi:hypothetical protein